MKYGINEAMSEINEKIQEDIELFTTLTSYANNTESESAIRAAINSLEGIKYKIEIIWSKLEKSGLLDRGGI